MDLPVQGLDACSMGCHLEPVADQVFGPEMAYYLLVDWLVELVHPDQLVLGNLLDPGSHLGQPDPGIRPVLGNLPDHLVLVDSAEEELDHLLLDLVVLDHPDLATLVDLEEAAVGLVVGQAIVPAVLAEEVEGSYFLPEVVDWILAVVGFLPDLRILLAAVDNHLVEVGCLLAEMGFHLVGLGSLPVEVDSLLAGVGNHLVVEGNLPAEVDNLLAVVDILLGVDNLHNLPVEDSHLVEDIPYWEVAVGIEDLGSRIELRSDLRFFP